MNQVISKANEAYSPLCPGARGAGFILTGALPEGQGHHINMCQLLWALDVLILERKGNSNTRRKILLARERSTIDTQLTHKRTTPDMVSVVRGAMQYRGGQFSSDRRGADFSRGMH